MASTALRVVYNNLIEHVRKYKILQSVNALADWDELVMMPPKGAESRGLQKTVLASLTHDLQTSPLIEKYLSELVTTQDDQKIVVKNDSEFDEYEISNIILIHKEFIRNTKITKELVERASELSSRGYHQWVEARKKSDWTLFQDTLQEWVNIRKEMSLLIEPNQNIADTLLDEYDPGMTCEQVAQVFEDVKKELIPLIQAIRKKVEENPEKYSDASLLAKIQAGADELFDQKEPFPVEKQTELSKQVAQELGFDFEMGRLDVSVHPFSTSFSTNDVRITTRYNTKEFVNGLGMFF